MMKKKTLKSLLLLFFVALGWNAQAQDPCPNCDPLVFDPVCVVEQGDTITLPNPCFAECLGYDSTSYVTCNITVPDPCICPWEFDPVCVVDAAGDTLSFSNLCFAECEGYTAMDTVTCDFGFPDPCNCDFTLDPVCVNNANGDVQFFLNACHAECEGYTTSDFVVCDSFPGGGGQNDCYASFYVDYDMSDPLTVHLNDLSQGATSWSWDFGDGNTSTDQNPSHTYTDGGVYDITLTIEGDSCSAIYMEHICIGNWNGGTSDCDAFFFYNQNDPNSLEVEFTDLSWGIGTITDWAWDFGDGNSSTDQNPTHTYADEGQYEVSLTITSDDSCTSTLIQEVWIGTWGWGNDCYAAFYYDQPDVSVPTLEFTDDSYGTSAITSWAWDFGDGNTSTDQNPVHTYAADGDYIVSLTINTLDNCTSTSDYFVFVGDNSSQVPWTGNNCQAFFLFTQDANDEMTINFEDISMTNEPITEWFWEFGDGNVSSDQHPTHTYASSGVYPVTLSISTDSCESNFIMLVFAGDDAWYPADCQALFLPLMSGTDVFLLNLSTSNDAVDYLWDFGDGNTSTEQMPSHSYAAIGDYTITLTITSANGCTSTFTVGVDLLDGLMSSNATQSYMTTTTSNEELSIVGKVKSYPNPAIDIFNLELSTTTDKEVQINIRTVNGTQLSRNTYQLNTGENKIQLDVARLISGVYFVEILEGDQVKTIKFLK